MLALEPNAQISSSTKVNPGVPETAGAGIGQLPLAPFVSQRAVFDWLQNTQTAAAGLRAFNIFPVDTLAGLIGFITPELFNNALSLGFLKVDEGDPTKFQILRRLHIVYPADLADPKKLKPGGRLPVVVLVHGNHGFYDGAHHIPSHLGYFELQKELASRGIVSVSVDTNAANLLDSKIEMRAESVMGALDDLRAMDADDTSLFHHRLDFDNVGMMGHSRGGDAVVRAAIINTTRPTSTRYKVKAVCSLAPTDASGTATPTRVYSLTTANTPFYAVVYGALDGDVGGFGGALSGTGTGFRHYDRANTQKAMVFLDYCNHNRFNDKWDTDDSNCLAADVATTTGRVLSRPDHHTLLNDYIGGLFRWHLLGNTTPKSLFDGTAPNSLGTRAPASIQWSFWQKRASLDDFDNPPSGTRDPGAMVENMAEVLVSGVKIGKHTNHQTRVVVAPPNNTTASEVYRLNVAPSQKDWSKFDQLTFRVCADADVSDATTTAASKLPEFTLTLTSPGKTVDVTAVSLRTVDRPRRPVFHDTKWSVPADKNCTVIRLETLAVNLASLADVDLTDISTIVVTSPVAFDRHQFLDSFQLIKK